MGHLALMSNDIQYVLQERDPKLPEQLFVDTPDLVNRWSQHMEQLHEQSINQMTYQGETVFWSGRYQFTTTLVRVFPSMADCGDKLELIYYLIGRYYYNQDLCYFRRYLIICHIPTYHVISHNRMQHLISRYLWSEESLRRIGGCGCKIFVIAMIIDIP